METAKRAQLICVVDDDNGVRTMIARKLEEDGFEVMQAKDGLQAIAALKKRTAKVAIVDIIMPDQEGLATIAQIKKNWPEIRILAMSGGGRGGPSEYLSFAVELGADEAMAKPFRESELLERVRRLASP